MKRRRKFAMPWARAAAAGAALALCPAGALAAACADALVVATGHRNFKGATRTGVLVAMNAAMGVVAAAAGLVSCGVVPAALAGGALAWAVGGSLPAGRKRRAKARGCPPWVLEGEIVDAEFTDPRPSAERADSRSEAVSVLDPGDIWVHGGNRARRRF